MDFDPQLSNEESLRLTTRAFLGDVFRLYRRHRWLFLKLVIPAVVFGYIAVIGAAHKSTEIIQHLPRGRGILQHQLEMFEALLIRMGGFFVSWLVYCFAFAGICSAVAELEKGELPNAESSLEPARRVLWPVMRISSALFFALLTGWILILFLVTYIVAKTRMPWTGGAWLLGLFASLGLLVLSRFGLAVPAAVLDGLNARSSFLRSDEFTEGRWTILLVLVIEYVGGSLAAAWFPFWVADLVLRDLPNPMWLNWVLYACSIFASALIQPTMFVGFALLYLRTKAVQQTKSAHRLLYDAQAH